ncbi:O-antigen ligase domain-containing protein [Sulfuricurvum sp. IAE1]|uniref:O-antigen ligase family protein n=1 Tax=Sulfuricurvum sp. IAE1 TaxID=2546102 RepID=UPI0010448002|nr:O-antigen ligase family protein [Sulfuricurvum sp. IAE1]TDA69564.1 O-antigen ligase domain-containing protein [Sulfuricurvum sp. IAE1]
MILRLFSFDTVRSYREQSALAANYLLILYAFLLPVAPKAASKVFIGIAVLMLFSGGLKEKFFRSLKHPVVLSFILFYLMHALWMFGSEHISTALFKLKEFKYLLYVLVITMILQKGFVSKILGGFIAGISLSVLISLSMFSGLPILELLQKIPLVTVNTIHPNVPFMVSYTAYSISLVLVANLMLYRLLVRSGEIFYLRFLYALIFIGTSTTVFLVDSRLGYILYGISILFTIAFAFRRYFYRVAAVSSLLVGTTYVLLYSYSPSFESRVDTIVDDARNSMNASYSSGGGIRIGYYVHGWEVIRNNPIFGVGTGDHLAEVIDVINRFEKDPANRDALNYNYKSGDSASFDSEYLDTVVQFGIVGLLVFFNIAYRLIRDPQPDPYLKYFQYLLALSIVMIAGPSLIFIPSEVGKALVLLAALSLSHPIEQRSRA